MLGTSNVIKTPVLQLDDPEIKALLEKYEQVKRQKEERGLHVNFMQQGCSKKNRDAPKKGDKGEQILVFNS